MSVDISHDLEYWQHIARNMAEKYEKPFKVVKPEMSHGYGVCASNIKTDCEEVWNTEMAEPIEQDIFETEPDIITDPVPDTKSIKLRKTKALMAKLQAKITQMEGEEA